MFRNRSPPMPQPSHTSAASSESNALSVQVQQVLAMVLPEPLVTVLASISDLLYRAVLGKPNEPPTYTSTLVPPIMLICVTYLSLLLVYRSIKSFFTFIIFSLKWAVILAALVFLVAYSLGNGNVEQGARMAAQQSGLDLQGGTSWSDALQRHPAAQQAMPYLFQAGRNLGGMAVAVPFMQDASRRLTEMMQGSGGAERSMVVDGGYEPGSKKAIVREYRDVRPSKKRFSFSGEEGQGSGATKRTASRSASNPSIEVDRKRSAGSKQGTPSSSNDSAMERIAKFMGADLSGQSGSRGGKQRSH